MVVCLFVCLYFSYSCTLSSISTNGGLSFSLQNPAMPNANDTLEPTKVRGVREVAWSHDGSIVYATSHTYGFWRKLSNSNSWQWLNGTDFPLQIVPHPTENNIIAVSFVTPSCWDPAKGTCQRPLRVSLDGGLTFTEIAKQVIQFYWSHQSSTLFYSEHYDPNTHWYQQDWYHSKLLSVTVPKTSAAGGFGNPKVLLDHESGSLYRNGTLLSAQRVSADSNKVLMYTSSDEGTTMVKAVFRLWAEDEMQDATAYNILEFNGGSIFINVRKDRADRGDLYMSGAFDHDFNLILTDNVRRDAYADVAHLGSVRGVYIANIWTSAGVPEDPTQEEGDESPLEEEPTEDPQDGEAKKRFAPLYTPTRQLAFRSWGVAPSSAAKEGSQINASSSKKNKKKKKSETPRQEEQQVTGITYDNGGNWDFVKVPEALRAECSSTTDWCALHFLGRSDSDIGQSPYAPKDAVGISMATGNVGMYLDRSPNALSTFLTRDAGVTWTKIADGDNRYQVCDRGGVIAWLPAQGETDRLTWSWDEGASHLPCLFGSLGPLSVYGMTTSPSRDGLRIHLLSSDAGAQHYITTVDFSSLATLKCSPADYEMWSPKDPDGTKPCLLGATTTYRRRKANVECFNVDNDAIVNVTNCACEEDDYECDDCFRREVFWDPKSPCIPDDFHTCAPAANPCAGGVTQYAATRGYKKVPFDTCVSDSSDQWQPEMKDCIGGSTQSTKPTTLPPTAPPTASTTAIPTTTRWWTSAPTTTVQWTTTPATNNGGNSHYGIIAVVTLLVLLAGLIGGFFVLRRNPRFQTWANGRFPSWLVPAPEEPYSTLGELEAPSSLDEDFVSVLFVCLFMLLLLSPSLMVTDCFLSSNKP